MYDGCLRFVWREADFIKELSVEKQQEMIHQLVQRMPLNKKKMKISQTEFGQKVGLGRQAISSIERSAADLLWNNYLAIMMFVIANKSKYKSMYQEDSAELIAF